MPGSGRDRSPVRSGRSRRISACGLLARTGRLGSRTRPSSRSWEDALGTVPAGVLAVPVSHSLCMKRAIGFPVADVQGSGVGTTDWGLRQGPVSGQWRSA